MKIFEIHIHCFWIRKIEDFYAIIANGLNFPKYFSYNLDSLSECLSDLSWIEEEAINIFFHDSTFFLKSESLERKQLVLHIFEEAVHELQRSEEDSSNKKLSVVWKV